MNKLLAVLILTGVLSFSATIFFLKEMNDKENKIKAHVGETVIIDKDTLTILDYSMLTETYKLSDGRTISVDYQNKNR